MNNIEKEQIIKLIHREVIPAIGCTEPVAVALASAKAAEILGQTPETVGQGGGDLGPDARDDRGFLEREYPEERDGCRDTGNRYGRIADRNRIGCPDW